MRVQQSKMLAQWLSVHGGFISIEQRLKADMGFLSGFLIAESHFLHKICSIAKLVPGFASAALSNYETSLPGHGICSACRPPTCTYAAGSHILVLLEVPMAEILHFKGHDACTRCHDAGCFPSKFERCRVDNGVNHEHPDF